LNNIWAKEVCCLNNLHELISSASNSDRSSFDILVELYNTKLVSIAKYYVQDEAYDIVQQVWLKIWQKSECLKEVNNLDAWLSQVTRYQCFEFSRNKSAKNRNTHTISFDENYELIDALISNDDYNPEETSLRNEASRALKKYIYELKEIYALPIMLYYIEGFTLTEISSYLNLPVSTAKWRLHSGRQLLKKIILKGGLLND
jgi:RNA polymerase sigma-70 factor (ECF subfamily)